MPPLLGFVLDLLGQIRVTRDLVHVLAQSEGWMFQWGPWHDAANLAV